MVCWALLVVCVSVCAVCVPPPPPEATWCEEPSGPPPREPVHVGGEISEQQARAALLCHVTDHCCYGRSAARHMAISKINYTSAHHVRAHPDPHTPHTRARESTPIAAD